LKIGPIGFPKTPVINYQSKLRNIPQGLKFHLYRAAEALYQKHKRTAFAEFKS
jgi:hypothetical protein